MCVELSQGCRGTANDTCRHRQPPDPQRALPCRSVAVRQQALHAQPAGEQVLSAIGEQPRGPVDGSTVGELERLSGGDSVDAQLQPVVVADGVRPAEVDEERAVELRNDGLQRFGCELHAA